MGFPHRRPEKETTPAAAPSHTSGPPESPFNQKDETTFEIITKNTNHNLNVNITITNPIKIFQCEETLQIVSSDQNFFFSDLLVVLSLPSRSLELQHLQRHKPSSWQWAHVPVPIDVCRPSVTVLSHWPPEVCPPQFCCPRYPPSRLWCTCCGPRVCSCLVGWAALHCLAGRCRWAATGDQRWVKTNNG